MRHSTTWLKTHFRLNDLIFDVNPQLPHMWSSMVEERAKAGTKALSDWMRSCRVALGELRGEI